MWRNALLAIMSGFLLCSCGEKTTAKSSDNIQVEKREERNIPSLYVENDPIPSGTKIVVNIPAREVRLYHENKIVYRFPVAVGSPVYKTPIGERSLSQIVWNPWWMPPDSTWAKEAKKTPPGPNNPLGIAKMDLGGTILLHGTNKEYTVGTPASHGCMRMFAADVKTLAWWVQSHFSDKTDPSLLDKYSKNRSTSYYVKINNPIPVEIKYDIFEIQEGNLKIHPDVYGKMGNRKNMIMAFLATKGITNDKIDDNILNKAIDTSTRDSQQVALRDLMPSKLMASKTRLSDPVQVAWNTYSQKQSKFAKLMALGMQ